MAFGRMGLMGRGFGRMGSVLGRAGVSTPAPGTYVLPAGLGTFVFTGDGMTPLVDYKLPSALGTFTLTGNDAGILAARTLPSAQGAFTLTGIAATLTKSSSYTGPGDIVSGAIGWYSPARAYSAAFAAGGTAIMDLVDQAGANPVTINILPTGYADLAAISSWVTANTVTTIRVTKLYDQSGSGNHLTNVTLAQMPALVLSSLNGLPGLLNSNARTDRLVSGNITRAQPVSFSVVAKRTSSVGAGIIGSNSGSMAGLVGTTTTANSWTLNGGSNLPATASDNAFHAGQAVLNGASSALVIDSSVTSGAGGATGYSAAPISIGRGNGASFDGTIMEAGVWPSAFTTTATTGQCDLINANQHGLLGYNF